MKKLIHIAFFIVFLTAILFIYTSLDAETKKGKGYDLKDTTLKVIWREDVFDKELNQKVNVIKLNDSYFMNISDPEKAVLGYLASTIGNECAAEGKGSNVKCKILSALNLGAQCSDANKLFLKSWFADNPEIITQVENCKPKPNSSVMEKTFDEVTMTTGNNMIKVNVKGLDLNFKESTTHKWTETLSFSINENKLTLLDRKKLSLF